MQEYNLLTSKIPNPFWALCPAFDVHLHSTSGTQRAFVTIHTYKSGLVPIISKRAGTLQDSTE